MPIYDNLNYTKILRPLPKFIKKDIFDFLEDILNFLSLIIDKFSNRPVGLESIAAALGEDAKTIEDVWEPYLLQKGLLERTPRGRRATDYAFKLTGLDKYVEFSICADEVKETKPSPEGVLLALKKMKIDPQYVRELEEK